MILPYLPNKLTTTDPTTAIIPYHVPFYHTTISYGDDWSRDFNNRCLCFTIFRAAQSVVSGSAIEGTIQYKHLHFNMVVVQPSP